METAGNGDMYISIPMTGNGNYLQSQVLLLLMKFKMKIFVIGK